MENINTIVFGIFALFGVIGALIGFSKGLIRSAVKVVTIILAFVVAFSITPLFVEKAYELALPAIDDMLVQFGDVFVASPTLKEFFPTLVQALVKPVVFIVVFVLCLLVAGIVRAIINSILKAVLPKKKGLIGRLGGLALGLVGGVIIALCFVFPVAGYFTAVPNIYTNVSDVISTEENPIDPSLEEAIINLPNNQSIKFTNDLTSDYFNKLVSYKSGEKDVSALDDLVHITSIVPPALRFLNSVGDIETMDEQAIRDIATILDKNDNLRSISAEILSYASQKWINNESFMGFNLNEKFDPDYKIVLDLILVDLANCTPDTIVDVLNDMADTIYAVKTALFPPVIRFANSIQNLSNIDDQAVRDIGQVLSEHAKLRSMATEIVNHAAGKWLNNEGFMGININEMLDAELKAVFDPMLSEMANCTQDTIVDIINDVADAIGTVKSIIPSAKDFVNSVSSISTLDDQAVRDIGKILEDNDEFRALATDMINTAATKWLNGEEFMGYNLQEKFDSEYAMVLDLMLEDLSQCTTDTVVEVLNKIANTIQTVREVFG